MVTQITRRMPVRTTRIELDGDYEGWWVEMRTNPPLAAFDELNSGDFARMRKTLASLIVDWNFVDEEGEPLLSAREGGVNQCTLDLMTLLVKRYDGELSSAAALPKA